MALPTDDELRELIADGHVVRGLTIYQCDDLAQAYLDRGAEIARMRSEMGVIRNELSWSPKTRAIADQISDVLETSNA